MTVVLKGSAVCDHELTWSNGTLATLGLLWQEGNQLSQWRLLSMGIAGKTWRMSFAQLAAATEATCFPNQHGTLKAVLHEETFLDMMALRDPCKC